MGLTIWGRPNSVNVQKVLWCLAELDTAYERIDAGMQFGRNNEADYLAMNPNGRVPTLVDGVEELGRGHEYQAGAAARPFVLRLLCHEVSQAFREARCRHMLHHMKREGLAERQHLGNQDRRLCLGQY